MESPLVKKEELARWMETFQVPDADEMSLFEAIKLYKSFTFGISIFHFCMKNIK